jgi:hypothetical protein
MLGQSKANFSSSQGEPPGEPSADAIPASTLQRTTREVYSRGLHRDRSLPRHRPQSWDHATRAASVRFSKEEKEPTIVELHTAILVITEQAEDEAELILQENMKALDVIAQGLRRGPMSGSDIRAIIKRTP